jgi:hypothetical protein
MSTLFPNRGAREEVAEPFRFIALRLDEQMLAADVVGMVEGRGGEFIADGIDLEGQGFDLHGAVKAGTELIGFGDESDCGHGISIYFWIGLKLLHPEPILGEEPGCAKITAETSESFRENKQRFRRSR